MSDLHATAAGLVQPCPACGQKNRRPFARLLEPSRCGACGDALAAPGEPVEIREEAGFDALVAASPVPVLVDIWAPWCGPCRGSAPEVAKTAAATAGRALVCKLNSDDFPDLCSRLQVNGIPDFRVFAGGKQTGRQVGGIRSANMLALLGLSS